MKILLVSLYDAGGSLGIKSIFKVLRREKHEVKLLFFDTPRLSQKEPGFFLQQINYPTYIPPVSENDLALFKQLLTMERPGLIGFSLLSSHFNAAVILSRESRKISPAPIVWGGVHAMVDPGSCLPHADYVCNGEGEEAILELIAAIEQRDFKRRVKGFWNKKSDYKMQLPERTFLENLGQLPVEPIEQKDVLFIPKNRPQIIWNQEIQTNTPYHSAQYIIMASRGCPMSCKYCINGWFRENLELKKSIRIRPVEHVIKELALAKRMRRLNHVTFMDDFFPTGGEWLREFGEKYPQHIGLPFFINFYPVQVKPETVELLIRAGLITANMGIQSGSSKIRKDVFGRSETNQQILDAAKVLNSKINMRYELISDNPFETEEDVRETLDLLLQFPLPFSVMVFSLTFFPNYPITRMAIEQGFIDKDSTCDELNRDILMDRRDKGYANPVVQSLYHLIAAAAKEEFKREELYNWSRDNELLKQPASMKTQLNQVLEERKKKK